MADEDRRRELREFLTAARGRLAPCDVGLPATGKRRVPGLRREEVAEIAGVTPLWYRWFETGREMRVSEQFLERLAAALRLQAQDSVTLYRLALSGLYHADRALLGAGELRYGASAGDSTDAKLPGHDRVASKTPTGPASPIEGEAHIDEAARAFARDRERFLCESHPDFARTRMRVLRSWERSRALGVDAWRNVVAFAAERDAELAERREASERLMRAASAVLASLVEQFADTGYAVALTDARGCLLQLGGDLAVRRRLARMHFAPGGDWSETAAGTNAIGTALTDRRPMQLTAAEHFCDGWRGFTCTAAPIHAPVTGEVLGALDLTGDYRLVRRRLVGVVVESALEIEERLFELG